MKSKAGKVRKSWWHGSEPIRDKTGIIVGYDRYRVRVQEVLKSDGWHIISHSYDWSTRESL